MAMSAFSGASAASCVIPWLLSAAQSPSSGNAQSLVNVAYAGLPAGLQAWLPAAGALQLSLPDAALGASTVQKCVDKEPQPRAEPLDLSVKAELAACVDNGSSKDHAQLQLAALTSLIPYWNALIQSQLTQGHGLPLSLSAANPLALTPNVLAALAPRAGATEPTPSDRQKTADAAELSKLMEKHSPRLSASQSVKSPPDPQNSAGNTSLFGRGCKFDAFCQQLGRAPPPSPPDALATSSGPISELQTPLRTCDPHEDDSKFTDYSCTCGKRYSTVYHLARHLCESGHKPVNNRDEGNDIVKLVRGQDMWLNNETEQTRQILRCMQCKMSCANLTELILHMVTTKHFAEIVYGSSSIAERYKLNECIFNDATSTNDADNEPEMNSSANAPLLSLSLSPTGCPRPRRRTHSRGSESLSHSNSPDAVLDCIDVIGDGVTDHCDAESPKQRDANSRKRTAEDDEPDEEEDSRLCCTPKRRRISSSDAHSNASVRGQLTVIHESTPCPSPHATSALHSLSKFCENMRFEPASVTATRSHTPLSAPSAAFSSMRCDSPAPGGSRRDGEQTMHVLMPETAEAPESNKHGSSPLRSLEKFVRKNNAAANNPDAKNTLSLGLDVKVSSAPATCSADEPTSTTDYVSGSAGGLHDVSRSATGSHAGREKSQCKARTDKGKNKRVSSAETHDARANGQTQIPILKKCVCEYCHKRFANKGQVRLHLSKNKCAVLLACFGHQRLQKMSASSLLSGSRAMVLNSLLYSTSVHNGPDATAGAPSDADADAKDERDGAACATSSAELADRFAKYYEMARTLTGNYNSSS